MDIKKLALNKTVLKGAGLSTDSAVVEITARKTEAYKVARSCSFEYRRLVAVKLAEKLAESSKKSAFRKKVTDLADSINTHADKSFYKGTGDAWQSLLSEAHAVWGKNAVKIVADLEVAVQKSNQRAARKKVA